MRDIRDDRGMRVLCEQHGFAAEPRAGVAARLGRDLHGDRRTRMSIGRTEDAAHAAAAHLVLVLEALIDDVAWIHAEGTNGIRNSPRMYPTSRSPSQPPNQKLIRDGCAVTNWPPSAWRCMTFCGPLMSNCQSQRRLILEMMRSPHVSS